MRHARSYVVQGPSVGDGRVGRVGCISAPWTGRIGGRIATMQVMHIIVGTCQRKGISRARMLRCSHAGAIARLDASGRVKWKRASHAHRTEFRRTPQSKVNPTRRSKQAKEEEGAERGPAKKSDADSKGACASMEEAAQMTQQHGKCGEGTQPPLSSHPMHRQPICHVLAPVPRPIGPPPSHVVRHLRLDPVRPHAGRRSRRHAPVRTAVRLSLGPRRHTPWRGCVCAHVI
jgi:hypothetical protein